MAGDPKHPRNDKTSPRVEQALKLLAEEARERLQRHPSGHLLGGRNETVDLSLTVPTGSRGASLDALAAETTRALDLAVASLVTHQAAFRPGAVYCLRCNDATCEHARPPGPRQVFAGYGTTGLPRFLDFAQLLLERSDPRIDQIYGARPKLLAHTLPGRDLNGELLPAFRTNEAGYRLHGQVVAGWYPVRDTAGRPAVVALSFQVVSTRPQGSPRRRYGLNVLGTGPEGEPLEHLFDRIGELPWTPPVRWAQEALESIERSQSGGKRRRKKGEAQRAGAEKDAGEPREGVAKRLTGVLNGLARRVEKDRRAHQRKTHHARQRHAQGDRPTHMALADLARADDADVLVDRQQETLVVLGDKGRAHVFNPEGKLVTSIRYNPESIERRRKKDQWRPASSEEIARLRGSVRATGS